MILDIGPRSARARCATSWPTAGTIVWNGPVGVFEFDAFRHGTETSPARSPHRRRSASPAAATRSPPSPSTASRTTIDYISTGGGAFLEVLEGKTLPALEILERARAAKSRRGSPECSDRSMRFPRATKIVATLGPASSTPKCSSG
jgi:phosphoglycerate kinase